MNWFLYVVKESTIVGDDIIESGQRGVGRCSMGPGILEAPYGLMYVIPHEFVVKFHKEKGQKKPCASIVGEAAEAYFGVTLKDRR
ncbi:MAG: hypothetical protein H8E12_25155 [Rhodobacteraceae bacterium]|nr:hypothetical protein [Paracoccaceae bacterium]